MKTAPVLFALIASLPSLAAVPDVLTYAGSLRRGDVPADGTFSVVVSLFDDDTGGSARFTQTEASLAVTAGELIIDLGGDPSNPLDDDVLESGELFLAIVVDGEELSPRVPLTSVPFARRARTAEAADSVGGLTAEDIATLYEAGAGLVKTGTTFSLANNGVTSAQILDGSIANADLASNAVTSANIVDGTVTGFDLAPGAVSGAALASGSVTSDKLGQGAVLAAALAGNAVDSSKILDNSVNSLDVQNDSLTSADLGTDSCGPLEIAPNSVSTQKIANGSVTADDLAIDSVDTEELAVGAVAGENLAVFAVTSSKIAPNAVIGSRIAEGAITRSHLNGGGVIIYKEAGVCPGAAEITLSDRCFFAQCGVAGSPAVPAGCSCSAFQTTCPNEELGLLVKP